MTAPLRIRLEPRAQQEIETASRWWAENRPAAPSLFWDELERAYELIRTQPRAGQPARRARLKGVRRVLLMRTRYHLYYRVSDDEEAVVVLSLWHTSRGQGPAIAE